MYIHEASRKQLTNCYVFNREVSVCSERWEVNRPVVIRSYDLNSTFIID